MNKTVITFSTFKTLIAKICRDITISGWKPDYVVGITRGGLLPAVMISHYLKVPCNTLNVSLRDGVETESNLWMAEDAFGYTDTPKNILIVDDINDTGATINWIIKDWQGSCLSNDERWKTVWNNNVRFATVVENLASESIVKIDYTAHEINKAENDIWIEFPYEEWWTK
jgi:hypoxanthine phosphoribosyltransferase